MNRRAPFIGPICLAVFFASFLPGMSARADQSGASRDVLVEGFHNPPVSCRPHTRWWWMGNALTKDDITWQLEQMRDHGIGGVEQITMQEVYEKGNHPYLSDAYLDLLRHAVHEADRLRMEFSINFGGPGWVFGGDWVPWEDRNQNLLASSLLLTGGQTYSGPLPTKAMLNPRDVARSRPDIRPDDRLVAVIAGRVVDGRLQESSLTDLSARVDGRRIQWDVPDGQWQLMAFWLTYVENGTAVDHLNEAAMTRYCDHIGQALESAVGDEFGKTVESVFSDSFEVPIYRNGLYWNKGLLEKFKTYKGYDLTRYLPALWWEVDDLSPKIRYDVNEFLHHTGMEAFFEPFLKWCAAHDVKGRIQPYGFTTDVIEGAGRTDIPEMEITAGEKDAVPWFDTRIGPKKYVASGAHLYGRNVVSTEAYTYLHWDPYRATLEELKIASDIFLRCGANKFYNHGFTGIPERDIAPTRGFYAAFHISPDNVWWPYYPLLSDYLARCCYLLRQGSFTADVAVYSPLANQWTRDVLNARRWTRDFDWGELGRLLIANGYDFDLINDDILQHAAKFEAGALAVRDMRYRVLILPNIEALPLESMKRIREYVKQGGTVVALERVPDASTGMTGYREGDATVRRISAEMFEKPVGRDGTGSHAYGAGRTHWIKQVLDRSDVLDRRSSTRDPFIKTLRQIIAPDFGVDFVRQDWRDNPGLTFVHRRQGQRDIYFVTNVQDHAVSMPVAFRVSGKTPWFWNPYTGSVAPCWEFVDDRQATNVPVHLAPYASTFVVFEGKAPGTHVTYSDLASIVRVGDDTVEALADVNGAFTVELSDGTVTSAYVEGALPPLNISGDWHLILESDTFPRVERTLDHLTSWTEDPATRHFSGTGVYTLDFDLPPVYLEDDVELRLDLGDVGNVAEVLLNGDKVGVAWMRGQQLAIASTAHKGFNQLEVRVTNTLINRVSGLSGPPPVPEELRPRLGSGKNDTRQAMSRLIGFYPLPRSGLLGPVRICALKRVRLSVPGAPTRLSGQ